MIISDQDVKNAIASAVKITEAAVGNAGSQALTKPEQVTELIAAIAAKLLALMENPRQNK